MTPTRDGKACHARRDASTQQAMSAWSLVAFILALLLFALAMERWQAARTQEKINIARRHQIIEDSRRLQKQADKLNAQARRLSAEEAALHQRTRELDAD